MTREELQNFYDKCQSFDWYFDWSDDGSVWDRGQKNYSLLKIEAASSPEKKSIFDLWHLHMFSGPSFGTEKAPRPARP